MIRPLRPDDLPALAAGLAALPLMRRYGRGGEALRRDLERALERRDGLLVLDEGGAPRGLLWYLPSATFASGGYLRLLALVGEAQGKGDGARLLAAFEEAVAAESRHAFLLVSEFNREAQRFYERHGYAPVGKLPGYVLPDVAELIFWKQLR